MELNWNLQVCRSAVYNRHVQTRRNWDKPSVEYILYYYIVVETLHATWSYHMQIYIFDCWQLFTHGRTCLRFLGESTIFEIEIYTSVDFQLQYIDYVYFWFVQYYFDSCNFFENLNRCNFHTPYSTLCKSNSTFWTSKSTI